MCTDSNIKMKSIKKEKEKIVIPTKIVIRRLPPEFTEEEFKKVVDPLPENNFFQFVPGDKQLGQYGFSRAYINFVDPDQIFSFRNTYDGYVFVDQKGNDYCAIVEYAPFQKTPNSAVAKKDPRCGTVDDDPDYVAFLERLQSDEDTAVTQIEAILEEIEISERKARENASKKIKTPLLEYVEQRNAERFRSGERRRRKEFERKKQREEDRRMKKEARLSRIAEEKTKRYEEYSEVPRVRTEEKSKRERAVRPKTYEKETEKFKSHKWEEKRTEERSSEPNPKSKTKRYSEVRKKEDKTHDSKTDDGFKRNRNEVEKEPKKSDEPAIKTSEPYKESKKLDSVSQKEPRKTHKPDDVDVKSKGTVNTAVEKEHKKISESQSSQNRDSSEVKNESKERADSRASQSTRDSAKDSVEDDSRKDRRSERKIRNKDRPTMQIYRPGQSRLKEKPKTEETDSGKDKATD